MDPNVDTKQGEFIDHKRSRRSSQSAGRWRLMVMQVDGSGSQGVWGGRGAGGWVASGPQECSSYTGEVGLRC